MIIPVMNPHSGKHCSKNIPKNETINSLKFKIPLKHLLNLLSHSLPCFPLYLPKVFSEEEWISAQCLKCLALLKT